MSSFKRIIFLTSGQTNLLRSFLDWTGQLNSMGTTCVDVSVVCVICDKSSTNGRSLCQDAGIPFLVAQRQTKTKVSYSQDLRKLLTALSPDVVILDNFYGLSKTDLTRIIDCPVLYVSKQTNSICIYLLSNSMKRLLIRETLTCESCLDFSKRLAKVEKSLLIKAIEMVP